MDKLWEEWRRVNKKIDKLQIFIEKRKGVPFLKMKLDNHLAKLRAKRDSIQVELARLSKK